MSHRFAFSRFEALLVAAVLTLSGGSLLLARRLQSTTAASDTRRAPPLAERSLEAHDGRRPPPSEGDRDISGASSSEERGVPPASLAFAPVFAAPDGALHRHPLALPAPRTPSREVPATRSRRADSPWRYAGLCANGAGSDSASARKRYLDAFAAAEATEATVYVDEGVAEGYLAAVQHGLNWIPRSAKLFLGLDPEPPVIYVYRSAQALRAHACVNESAVAYYDGAIHLAVTLRGPGDLVRSLRHEYVHHALVSHRIQHPTWLQEGAAMVFAAEPWSSFRFDAPPLDLDHMVGAFPHGITKQSAEAFYGQAFAMVMLLRDLCAKRDGCNEAELVHALRDGSAEPETLFSWAIRRRAPNIYGSELSLLQDYVTRGFRLSPAAAEAARLQAGSP